jgi:hypothetical protein
MRSRYDDPPKQIRSVLIEGQKIENPDNPNVSFEEVLHDRIGKSSRDIGKIGLVFFNE